MTFLGWEKSGDPLQNTQLNASTQVKLLRLFVTISFTNISEDNFKQLDNYGER